MSARSRSKARTTLPRPSPALSKPTRSHPPSERPTRSETLTAAAPVAMTDPAMIAAALFATACILYLVTYHIYDIDLWHNLAYGRAVTRLGRVPLTQMWTWPTYGQPDVNTSWLFRVLVWKLWELAGVWGLMAWRWTSTVAAFGLAWLAARRMGARGFVPLLVLLACALVYRSRAQIRPETFAALLLSASIWILETRRHGGPDRSVWLVAIAWGWINAHLSYYILFVVLGIYLLDAEVAARAGGGPAPRRLRVAGACALAVSLLNPFGWHALAWPFQYFFTWRKEPFYRDIAELRPISWAAGHTLLIAGWPLLLAWRARRRGVDLVETLMCLFLSGLVIMGQRFLGSYAVAAAPYVARDLEEWVQGRVWPAWTARTWSRAALAALGCLSLTAWEARRPGFVPGVGIEMGEAPVHACDFIEKTGIRGRAFNDFPIGGYMLYRFWPDRERLPFLGCLTEHSTRRQRQLHHDAYFAAPEGWYALDREYHFDYAVLMRQQRGKGMLLDILDADATWSLVFADDAAAVYVRRRGPLAGVAERHGYRVLGAGLAALDRLDVATATDSTLRARLVSELRREVSESPATSLASKMLGYIALLEGRRDEARREFRRAVSISPFISRVHLQLGSLALEDGQPEVALREFEAERARDPKLEGIAFRIGQAYARSGRRDRALDWYRRELEQHPDSQEARDSLTASGRGA